MPSISAYDNCFYMRKFVPGRLFFLLLAFVSISATAEEIVWVTETPEDRQVHLYFFGPGPVRIARKRCPLFRIWKFSNHG